MLCSSCVFRFGLILHKKGMYRYKDAPHICSCISFLCLWLLFHHVEETAYFLLIYSLTNIETLVWVYNADRYGWRLKNGGMETNKLRKGSSAE